MSSHPYQVDLHRAGFALDALQGELTGLGLRAPDPAPFVHALRQALSHNLGLGLQRLQAVDALDGIEVADSGFDLRLRWSNTLGKARTLEEIRNGDYARDTWSSELALEQPFTWGGVLALTGQACFHCGAKRMPRNRCTF
jgi:hypothetical protein